MNLNNRKYHVLIACLHYPVASGRYLARAFRRLGHEVKTVGPAMGRQVWGMEVDARHVWEPDALNPLADTWEPDLVLTSDSAYTTSFYDSPPTIPHVLYGVDNHVRDYRELPTETGHHRSDWDYKFLAHSWGYRMEDANSTWLPCGYDPECFTRQTEPRQRAQIAGMVGVAYPNRIAVIQALADAYPERVGATLGLLYEDYARFYNNTLVSVCQSINGDVAQRIFETAAMGCVILSDRCPDFERLGFEEGKHYLGFSTPQEAVSRMKQLLDMPDDKIAELAENAYRWALPHTWDARAQVILDTVFGGEA